MREVVFKALTSPENIKRDFRMKEVVEKNGVTARTEKRCFYFILGKMRMGGGNVEKTVRAKLPQRKRHYYILKVRDTSLGVEKLICKVAGSFYAVCGEDIYCIAFLHSFKVSFTSSVTSSNPENNVII